ncbi:uncharacterized protein LOC144155728 isoform X2 [Haemaphysalis longicornis]
MDATPSELDCDENTGPEDPARMLHALNTCARGDRDYGLFFEPSRERLKLLHRVLLFTDRDGSFERRASQAKSKEEIAECILKDLVRLNYKRADEFAAFVQGAASVSDQKRIWTLLLETAEYVEKKRSSSRQGKKTHNLIFEPPVTSSPLQSGLTPEPSAEVEPKGDASDLSSSSGRELKFPASGEETVESRRGFSFSHVEPTVICAGGSLSSLGEPGSGDTGSVSQHKQVPDKKLCEDVIEAARGLCLHAESLTEDVNSRLKADVAQGPRIDFSSAAVKGLYDSVCHFELLSSVTRNDK